MSDITREEFASAVATTISSVHHLYREVARLIKGLRDALSEEPGALIPVRGSAIGKSGLNPTRVVVRDAYGALFKPVVSDEEVDAAEDDEEESAADSDEGGPGGTSSPVELVADQPLMAVRVVLYDLRKKDRIEPQIQFGVMSDWRVGGGETTEGQRFILAPVHAAAGASVVGGSRRSWPGKTFPDHRSRETCRGHEAQEGRGQQAELSASSRGGDGAAVLARQPRRTQQAGRPHSRHVGQDERRNVRGYGYLWVPSTAYWSDLNNRLGPTPGMYRKRPFTTQADRLQRSLWSAGCSAVTTQPAR